MSHWTQAYFRDNRRKLAKKIQGGIVALAGHVDVQQRNDMAQPFKQDANFWYLSGIHHPGWQMIYDGARDVCWLIKPNIDPISQLFDGGISDDEALVQSGAQHIIEHRDRETVLRQIARTHGAVYSLDPKNISSHASFMLNPGFSEIHATLSRIFTTVHDVRGDLAAIRAIKTDDEVRAMERAIKLTLGAFSHVLEHISSYTYEYEIEAEFAYAFRKKGAVFAYDPIVAGGGRACTLHYTANDQRRPASGAVLLDIGAEVDGFCADITRTYTWSKSTKRLQQIHDALQAAHHEILSSIKPHMPLADFQNRVDEIMIRYMVEAKVLSSPTDPGYREYFPHAISHGLGIDVHESFGGSRTLEPGMTFTVEPGIYIPQEHIGLRIEDNILITKSGTRNMSKALSTNLS